MTDCLFCRIVQGKLPSERVHEDGDVIVIRDIYPKAPVHLLVIPRIHCDSLNELAPEHDRLIAHMIRLLPELARREGLVDGFRVVINTGRGGGQEILHLHIHLLGGTGHLPGF